MNSVIDFLTPEKYGQYDAFLRSVDYSVLYSSSGYCEFLKAVLPPSECRYLCAIRGGELIGVLPAFLLRGSRFGNVLNSLPFFGSYGGVTLAPHIRDADRVKVGLIEAFHALAAEESVVSSTLISNPLHPDDAFYQQHCRATLFDDRIGQITPLPVLEPIETLADRLAGQIHAKTRNHIRKAMKSGFVLARTNTSESFQALESIHRQNMAAIGGRIKSSTVFSAIQATFRFPDDYVLYTASKDERIVAALLVFFFNRTAEYFMPATEEGFRVYQPISLLVFEAMQDAVRRGCRFWNWGGTWLSQKGVYDFKARWGTQDHPYRYYICEHDGAKRLRTSSREELLTEYPNYYVLPFDALVSESVSRNPSDGGTPGGRSSC
jgi:hypothetical protein